MLRHLGASADLEKLAVFRPHVASRGTLLTVLHVSRQRVLANAKEKLFPCEFAVRYELFFVRESQPAFCTIG